MLTNILIGLVILSSLMYIFKDKIFRNDVEKFENLEPAPLNYGIGPYSNVRLAQMKETHPLITADMQPGKDLLVYTAQGTPLNLTENQSIVPEYSNGPSVDGTGKTPSQMFMMAFNQCKPECCPGTYSCDGGCICKTKEQDDFINTRGGNRTFPTEF